MYKITLFAVTAAFASANFLAVDDLRFLQSATNATTISAPCNRNQTTTEPCQAGYCCAAVTKNGAAAAAGVGLCVPTGFANQTFNNVSGANYAVGVCSVAATWNTWSSTTGCGNCSAQQCCASRSWTVGGVASTGSTPPTGCATNVQGAQVSTWASYASNSTWGAVDAKVTFTCPAPTNNGGTGGTSSFASAIQASLFIIISALLAVNF